MLLRSEEGLPEIGWQNKVASVKPSALNKICAHPMIVTWVLGACVLNAFILGSISHGMSLAVMISDWQTMEIFTLAFIPATGLGFFLGMFTCWPMVRVICSRYNGAPLKVGDQVLILTGPDKGKIVEVWEITVGQGGWELARLNLSEERSQKFRDIFEEYSLLKIKDKLQTASSPA
jgi:hypothetical protein